MRRKVRPRKILKGKGREGLHKRFSKGVDDLQAYNHVFNLHRIVVIPYSPACILFFSLFLAYLCCCHDYSYLTRLCS